jgi:hypothetical protein
MNETLSPALPLTPPAIGLLDVLPIEQVIDYMEKNL